MDAPPEISVVVPVYRHWTLVPDLVAALGRQTLGRDRFEILLVDNDPAAGAAPPPCPATPTSWPARSPAPTPRATPEPRPRAAR